MTTRLSFLATFFLITAAFFLSLIAIASASASEQTPEERPMNFAMARNGNCQEICVQWISAEGKITADTPKRFKKLLKSLKGKNFLSYFSLTAEMWMPRSRLDA